MMQSSAPDRFGLGDQAVELAESLPHVGSEADDARAVLFAQPRDDGGRIEPARIGEDDKGPVGLFMHMSA